MRILGERGPVVGVIGNTAIHIRDTKDEKVPEWHDLFVDIGASSRDEVLARGVRPHRVARDPASALARFRLAPEQRCANAYPVDYMAHHSLKQVEGGWVWKFDPRIMAADEERDAGWWRSLADRFAGLELPRAIICGRHSGMFSVEAPGISTSAPARRFRWCRWPMPAATSCSTS